VAHIIPLDAENRDAGFDSTIKETLNERLGALERHFNADVIFYYGEIHPYVAKPFRDFIEPLREEQPAKNRLVMFLNTPGGSAEAVEKIVEIMRFHYSEVYFVVPDFAMSAGTILCTSGDKIFMDYSSSLGPIDPQVLPSPSSSASSLVSSRRALPFSR